MFFSKTVRIKYIVGVFGILLFLALSLWIGLQYYARALNAPPDNFPEGKSIVVEEGMSHKDIAEMLEHERLIRSAPYFMRELKRAYPDDFLHAGMYSFAMTRSTTDIIGDMMTGANRSPLIRITLPEGFKSTDLYSLLPKPITEGTAYDVTQHEGYLFPDTYFISSNAKLEDVITLLRNTFTEKLVPFQEQIMASGYTEREIITLASIVEREARDTESKRMVAGILFNRLKRDMPLQVDAPFYYLLNKTSAELTEEDLETDSPYNTYRYKGIPPGPIANPGLDAIEAVLNPTYSEYLYYLTGTDGTFHYATTFEEHKKNKARYLR